jgi:hypothetical protein
MTVHTISSSIPGALHSCTAPPSGARAARALVVVHGVEQPRCNRTAGTQQCSSTTRPAANYPAHCTAAPAKHPQLLCAAMCYCCRCGLSPNSLVEMKRSTLAALQDCMDLEDLQVRGQEGG